MSIKNNIQNQIYQYKMAANQVSQASEMTSKDILVCNQLLNELKNPCIKQLNLQNMRQDVVTQIYQKISMARLGRHDASEGKKILTNNPREILQPIDHHGNTLIQQYDKQLCHKRDAYQDLAILNLLLAELISVKSCKMEAEKNSERYVDLQRFQRIALNLFNSLPNTPQNSLLKRAKDLLGEKIWELDNKPTHDSNYGCNTIEANVLKLLEHKAKSPINECIKILTERTQAPITFTIGTPPLPTTISPNRTVALQPSPHVFNEDPEIITEENKILQLKSLHVYLNNSPDSDDFLKVQFSKLHPQLQQFLRQIICALHNKPDDDQVFAEEVLKENPYILIKSQNNNSINLIMQLIRLYEVKIEARKLHSEIRKVGTCSQQSDCWNNYNKLSHDAKKILKHKLWYEDGGKNDTSDYKFTQDLWYSDHKIANNVSCLTYPRSSYGRTSIISLCLKDLKKIWKYHEHLSGSDQQLLQDIRHQNTSAPLPSEPIACSIQSLIDEKESLFKFIPNNLRIAVVTAEYAKIASCGGLAPAITGITESFDGCHARVIMPLYLNSHIPKEIISKKRETGYEVQSEGRKVKVFKYKNEATGVRFYFIDIPELFTVDSKHEKDFYKHDGSDYHHIRRRWAAFQNAAANLCYQFSKKQNHPIQLVHVHDAQNALIPKMLKKYYPNQWSSGKTPATVFTFHNNQDPIKFEGDSIPILEKVGLPCQGANSFIEGLKAADAITTVSERFAMEAQMANFGNDMHQYVKTEAAKGRVFGIVNGNTDLSPTKNPQLQKWRSQIHQGQLLDLQFGPHTDGKTLANQYKTIQREICTYLKNLDQNHPGYADLDPEKPIVMFLGRYDSNQKGLDKLKLIMLETIAKGAQFVCVGSVPNDENAKNALEELKRFAREQNHKGVLILIDTPGREYQNQFGQMLRAACTIGCFPSKFEPCGLVQGEFNRFGKKVFATRAGGFIDTLDDSNSYLFERKSNWDSLEQDVAIKETLSLAIDDAIKMQNTLYHGTEPQIENLMEEAKTIMRKAQQSTWETTPDGRLTPAERYELVYARALQNRARRGALNIDLKIPQM